MEEKIYDKLDNKQFEKAIKNMSTEQLKKIFKELDEEINKQMYNEGHDETKDVIDLNLKREILQKELKSREKEIENISEYNRLLEEYKGLLSDYKEDWEMLYNLQKQYEDGLIPYSKYEKHADFMIGRYESIKADYETVLKAYEAEKKLTNKQNNIVNDKELTEKLAELDVEAKELWQQGVHENTPDEKRYHEVLKEIDEIKAELAKRKENPFRGLTVEQLVNKLKELEENRDELYHFYAHGQNGMEQNDDGELEKIEDEIDRIKAEIEARSNNKELEALEKPEQPMMILENDKKIDKRSDKTSDYNRLLEEYKRLLSDYKEDWEMLYNLQKQYEDGLIPYSKYEKHADFMIGRYKSIKSDYEIVLKAYEEEKKLINNNKNKNNIVTDKELTEKLAELDAEVKELWQQGVHENTPDEKRYHEALKEIDEIKAELAIRKENPFRGLNDEELKQKLAELDAEAKELWQQGVHENTPDEKRYHEILDEIDRIKAEQKRRKDKELEETEEIEAPEKPEQPMMILENDKKGQNDIEHNTNLPVRSFWEIYSETNSEHANNLAIKLHNFAHMKIVPPKDEDTVTKLLSGIAIPVKCLLKLGASIPNKLLGTDKKLKKMQENIDNLSPEEFQVLVSNPEEANKLFGQKVKDSFDKDYLDPQFMKQYKVNELYLKAVGARLTRERTAGIQYYSELKKQCDARLADLDSISQSRTLTPSEQIEYDNLTTMQQQYVEEGKKLREEIDKFNDGVKKKSSAFKNIRGWFLGKFNPNNQKENEKMALLSKERREAAAKGDKSQVSKKTNEMSNFAKQQTNIKDAKIVNIKLDRGAYSIEKPIEMLNKGPETKGRLLLSNAAVIISAIDLVNQIRDAKNMQAQIDEHNAQINDANAKNTDIKYSGEMKHSDLDGAKGAQEGIAKNTVEGTWNRNERANLDANNWKTSSSGYKAGDLITHADGAKYAKEVQDAIARGDAEGALRIAVEYFQKNATKDEAASRAYAQTHKYDYTPINFDGTKDMQNILDFFSGTSYYNGSVSGVTISTLNGINNGVNPLAAIFAGANMMYQAQKQGVRDSFKERVKEDAKNKTSDDPINTGSNTTTTKVKEETEDEIEMEN